jgi:acyl-CoA synthetase (AMP-forming)/AMP-acid ligase II
MRVHDGARFYVRNQPGVVFGIEGDRTVSWGEAGERIEQFSAALAACGVGRGDRFGYLSKNSVDMAIMFIAAASCGAVPVPLNYRLAPAEWAYIVNDAGCALVVAQGPYVDALETVRGECAGVTTWVAVDAPDALPSGWTRSTEWLDAGDAVPDDRVEPDDVVFQMYTSGTTGRPKGVLLSHRNVMANVEQVTMTWTHRLDPGDRLLVCAPMYHVSGAVSAIAAAMFGITLVVHADFVPAAVVDALSDGGVVNTVLVPVMIQACLAVPGAAERDYSRLRTISYGAAPISDGLMRHALDVLGCELVQGFGQTEATSCITMLTTADHEKARAGRAELLSSVGRPLPGTEVRIVDPATDEEVPAGEAGEITVRGPQVMQGYWNAPEQTAQALRDGWLHTGDAGFVDAEGYVYIRDRIKDMIVTGGSNVYSVEVEVVLADHPDVADVAVIGVPDPRWGERVTAVVVPRAGATLELEDIQEHCRARLGGYKVPRQLEVVDALPRNATGKVLKNVLREPYWDGQERRVGATADTAGASDAAPA